MLLGIITSNFLKIRNGWIIVEKYATILEYVVTYFFPQFLENSRPHFNECNTLISSKKTHIYLNEKENDNSTKYLSGFTDFYQNVRSVSVRLK